MTLYCQFLEEVEREEGVVGGKKTKINLGERGGGKGGRKVLH